MPVDRHAQAEVDVVLRVPALRHHRDGVLAGLAQQVLLGQRRPKVGVVGLGAGDGDPARGTLGAQRAGSGGTGQARRRR